MLNHILSNLFLAQTTTGNQAGWDLIYTFIENNGALIAMVAFMIGIWAAIREHFIIGVIALMVVLCAMAPGFVVGAFNKLTGSNIQFHYLAGS